jgi:hypothetical protein
MGHSKVPVKTNINQTIFSHYNYNFIVLDFGPFDSWCLVQFDTLCVFFLLLLQIVKDLKDLNNLARKSNPSPLWLSMIDAKSRSVPVHISLSFVETFSFQSLS